MNILQHYYPVGQDLVDQLVTNVPALIQRVDNFDKVNELTLKVAVQEQVQE